MSQNALGRLHDLAVFVGAEEDLRTHLRELVDLAASVTDAATCSIMLLSEGEHDAPRLKLWASTEVLPSSAWNETPPCGESIAGQVLQQSRPLLIADIRASERRWIDSARQSAEDSVQPLDPAYEHAVRHATGAP